MKRNAQTPSTAVPGKVEFARYTGLEKEAADRIVDRALRLFREHRVPCTKMEVAMDLSAVHAKMPLRLGELADADDYNFAHDVAGIRRHLNRQTGELENCFVPRFAQAEDTLTRNWQKRQAAKEAATS